jgi:hypothetical protein
VQKKREHIDKIMSCGIYLKLSVTSVPKYNSEIWTWVVEPPPLPFHRVTEQEYAEMRIKIISQVHIIRNKLGNMYTVAVACAGLYFFIAFIKF